MAATDHVAQDTEAAFDRLLSKEGAAELLDVRPQMIADLRRAGSLQGVKVGRLWRYRTSELRRFIDSGGGPARGG